METNQPAEVQFLLHPGPGTRHGREARAGRLPRVTRVLALALSFQDMVASGKAKNHEELAERAGVSAERLSQVMKLLWLAPDIQQEILYLPAVPDGRYPVSELSIRHIARCWCWREQRERWNCLKQKLHLVELPPAQGSHPKNLQREAGMLGGSGDTAHEAKQWT